MRVHLGHRVCGILLGVLLLGWCVSYAQQDSFEVSEPSVISTDSIENTNAKIVATPEGGVFVVWQGKTDDGYHIFFREKKEQEWLEPLVIDNVKENNDFDPQICIDSKSNPHVVWVSREEYIQEIHYTHRTGEGEWIFEPVVRSSRELNLEFPVIALTSVDNSFIAWQEGMGVTYSIWCAFKAKDGNSRAQQVSDPSSDHYNIYPQLFDTPMSPMLTWYEAQEDGFALRAAAFIKDVDEWVDYPVEDMQLLPSNRLPILFSTPDGSFMAVWYDNIDGVDHILFGRQDEVDQCRGMVVDDESVTHSSLPSAVCAETGQIYISWRADIETVLNQIFFARIMNDEAGKSFLISDGMDNYYANPELAVDVNNRTIHVVWYSNFSEGGDGAIYYTTLSY